MKSKNGEGMPMRSIRISHSDWELYREAAIRKHTTITDLIRQRMVIYTKPKPKERCDGG